MQRTDRTNQAKETAVSDELKKFSKWMVLYPASAF